MPGASVPVSLQVERERSDVPLDEVSALLERTAAPDGSRQLSEGQWLDLLHGGTSGTVSGGFLAVLARRRGALVGYAQATEGHQGWELELVTDGASESSAAADRLTLVRASLAELGQEGGRVHVWVDDPAADDDRTYRGLGLAPDRDLLRMCVALPLAATASRGPAITVRPFRPGQDEEAWLEVNNRAFADHPEQGGWDRATLAEREAEAWFDASGFLMYEVDGRLAGSCWTKVHETTIPPMGEIYVISVDPDFHGRGLGRSLTVAGLDWLTGRGLHVGMLFTTASNVAAVGLYRSLGFDVDRVKRVYTADLGESGRFESGRGTDAAPPGDHPSSR